MAVAVAVAVALAVAVGGRWIGGFKIAETPAGAYSCPDLEGLENDSASQRLPAAIDAA